MPEPIIDLATVDLSDVQVPIEDVRKVNRQRFEMEQIDGILKCDLEKEICIAFKRVRPDEHWVRGHIPGRPLLPGVLLCECAAQTCSYYYVQAIRHEGFLGFGGMDAVRFRGEVKPGDTVIMAAKPLYLRRRIAKFQTQGFVNGKIVYEGVIIGVPI